MTAIHARRQTSASKVSVAIPLHAPAIGELAFVVETGELADGASANPIIDRDGTVYVGSNVAWQPSTAVVRCFGATTPSAHHGSARPCRRLGSRRSPLAPASSTSTRHRERSSTRSRSTPSSARRSSTSTSAIRVLDLAVRTSGALVASLVRETLADPPIIEGRIVEIDRFHDVATTFHDLGNFHAIRLAIDVDEAIVAIVADGRPGKGVHREHVVRLGLDGLPNTTHSTAEFEVVGTDLAIGDDHAIFWSHQRVRVSGLVKTCGQPSYFASPSKAVFSVVLMGM